MKYDFFCCAKAFKFNQVPFVYFCFYFHFSRMWVKKILLQFMSKSVLPMFSSKSFIVSGLIFRSLIHFEFIFVYGVKECSNFILLHVAVQFSQQHLLKSVFSPLCILAPFVTDQVTRGAWAYLWAFYSVPLIYISVFVPVPYCFDYCSFAVQCEVREPHTSSFIFLSQDCFGYSGSFVFPYKL